MSLFIKHFQLKIPNLYISSYFYGILLLNAIRKEKRKTAKKILASQKKKKTVKMVGWLKNSVKFWALVGKKY